MKDVHIPARVRLREVTLTTGGMVAILELHPLDRFTKQPPTMEVSLDTSDETRALYGSALEDIAKVITSGVDGRLWRSIKPKPRKRWWRR